MAKALAGDKVGEAVVGIITLTFATCSMLNTVAGQKIVTLHGITPNIASTLRVALFSVGAITSAHVLYRVQRTVREAKKHG
ncbi:hypothetical protein [Kordiimonas sp.]|uniref:hypothetical protein n=1 Tax=Kordiimonas sp. TaxID=1970157 RepID=UPI003A8CF2B7